MTACTTELPRPGQAKTFSTTTVPPTRNGNSSPAIVSAAAFCVHEGKFTEPVDAFDHPFWDWVRNNVSVKAAEIRNQGFSGPAMLPYSELEYGGVVEKMGQLDERFMVRKDKEAASAGNGSRKSKAA